MRRSAFKQGLPLSRLAVTILGLATAFGCCFAAMTVKAQTPEVIELFRQGAAAMRSGKSAEAETLFRRAVAIAPQMPEGHLDLALVLGREGKQDEAIASLHRALELNPDLPSAHMFLGIFLYQSNKPDEARKELKIELDRSSRNAEALTWLGTIDLAQGHPERAILSFDQAVELDPNNLALLEFRGRAHNLIARDSYAQMAGLDPNSWHVHRVQAQLHSDEGRHLDAVTEYIAAIKLQDNNPDLYEGLGDEYRSLNNLDAAAEAYRKGLALEPANPVASYNLGSIEIDSGHAKDGVSLLLDMSQDYPNSPVVEYYLGKGLAQLGRYEEAIGWLQKSVANAPNGEVAKRSWYELSRAFRRLNRLPDTEMALKNYSRLREAEEKIKGEQINNWKKLIQPSN